MISFNFFKIKLNFDRIDRVIRTRSTPIKFNLRFDWDWIAKLGLVTLVFFFFQNEGIILNI